MESIIPRFGKNKPEIELIYLNSRHDPRLANGTIDFWKGYLKASEIEDNKIAIKLVSEVLKDLKSKS